MAASQHQQANKKLGVLPILGYYITFMHYFGFSLSQNDETNTSYLINRVKRAATLPLRTLNSNHHGRNHNDDPSANRPDAPAEISSKTAAAAPANNGNGCISIFLSGIKFTAIIFTTFLALNHVIVLADYTYHGSKMFMDLMLEVRLVATKFSAMIFVLSWHFNQDEVKQVIKLAKSTSIYILGANEQSLDRGHSILSTLSTTQTPIPNPIPIPTSIPVPTSAQQRAAPVVGAIPSTTGRRAKHEWPDFSTTSAGVEINQAGAGDNVAAASNRRQAATIGQLDRRVLGWWLMCVSIPILHFSLSETELATAQHLWQWLDDYSLHQVSNETISFPTLMFLASVDNYIYTVHVYGTRLIGASIICIVCTFQRENIVSLRWQTLKLIRAYALTNDTTFQCSSPSRGEAGDSWSLESIDANSNSSSPTDFSPASAAAAAAPSSSEPDDSEEERDGRWLEASRWLGERSEDRHRHFVLGESDWLQVEQYTRGAAPIGYLSSSLHTWRGSFASLLRALASSLLACAINAFTTSPGFATPPSETTTNLGKRAAATARKQNGASNLETSYSDSRPTPTQRARRWPGAASEMATAPAESAKGQGGFDAAENGVNSFSETYRRLRLKQPLLDETTPRLSARFGTKLPERTTHLPPGGYFGLSRPPSSASGNNSMNTAASESIERHLELLANKYELIRTVNARIDSCFGPTLLIQYSFLFLMSCIDVVYFSSCFNPNTKTKYIIISGMILLWWPYLLMYKFASDIEADSKQLLTSVRRLARLALVVQHQTPRETLLSKGKSPRYDNTALGGGAYEQAFTIRGEKRLPTLSGNHLPAQTASACWCYKSHYTQQINKPANYNEKEANNGSSPLASGRTPRCLTFGNDLLFATYSHREPQLASERPSGGYLTRYNNRLAARCSSSFWRCTADGHLPQMQPPALASFRPRKLAAPEQPPSELSHYLQRNFMARSGIQSTDGGATGCRASILNKLDHVFKPTHLSIMGMMTMNKFFLLNFAKIVITASVMIIQFIS